MAESFVSSGSSWSKTAFSNNKNYGLNLSTFESSSLTNSPNLSILPLLAYHKICNDHYRNEKWQPFEPWTCNIDYLRPTDNMNAQQFINSKTFNSLMTSIIDLENSNLPIDYFTSVLPRAQYGDESAAPVGNTGSAVTLRLSDPADKSIGFMFNSGAYVADDTLLRENSAPTPYDGSYVSRVTTSSAGSGVVGLHGKITDGASSSLKISALRSATALQKYKEIQNSNDHDFS
jgi:hypothetical protein